jgi:hypothetical protein
MIKKSILFFQLNMLLLIISLIKSNQGALARLSGISIY